MRYSLVIILLTWVLNMQIQALDQTRYEKVIDTIQYEVSVKFFTIWCEKETKLINEAKTILDTLSAQGYSPGTEKLIQQKFRGVNEKLFNPINSLKNKYITDEYDFLFDILKNRLKDDNNHTYELTLSDRDLQKKITSLLDRNLNNRNSSGSINNTPVVQYTNNAGLIDSVRSEIKQIKDIIEKQDRNIRLKTFILVIVVVILFIISLGSSNKIKNIVQWVRENIKQQAGKKKSRHSLDDGKIKIAEYILTELKINHGDLQSEFFDHTKNKISMLIGDKKFKDFIDHINNEFKFNVSYDNTDFKGIVKKIREMPSNKEDKNGGGPEGGDKNPPIEETETSNIFYFSTPNEKGTFQDKYKCSKPNNESLFKFSIVGEGSLRKAEFIVFAENTQMIKAAINNTAYYLDPVCILKSKSNPGHKTINTVKPGTVTLNDQGIWEVTKENRAVIEFY